MYDSEFIQKLKQNNVSVNRDKTKERIAHLWKSLTSKQKQTIGQDTGNTRATIYRSYQTGTLTAKLAISLAQRFNTDPYYLSGETDANNGYAADIVERFLRERGYAKLLDKDKKDAPSPEPIPDTEDHQEDTPAETSIDTIIISTEKETEQHNFIDETISVDSEVELSEDDMRILLQALVLRARVNESAKRQLNMIKHLLLY